MFLAQFIPQEYTRFSKRIYNIKINTTLVLVKYLSLCTQDNCCKIAVPFFVHLTHASRH